MVLSACFFVMKSSRLVLFLLLFTIVAFNVHASVNNVLINYPFDSDFSDSTGLNNLVKNSANTTVAYNATNITGSFFKVGNGSAQFQTLTGGSVLNGTDLMVPASMSIAAWVNLSGPLVGGTIWGIFCYDNGTSSVNRWCYGVQSNGSMYLDVRNGSTVSVWQEPTINLGNAPYYKNWTFIGITVSAGTTPVFYINGVNYAAQLMSTTGATYWPTGITMNTRVGSFAGGGSYTGNIDELSIWDKILTSSDMSGLYNSGNGLSYPYSNASNLNFSVGIENKNGLVSTQRVVMQENSSDFNYQYALVCDWREETVWNDVFTSSYNATLQNTSYSGNTSLTFAGLIAHVNDQTNFNIVKTVNSGSRVVSDMNFLFTLDRNISMDYLQLASDGQITYYLRFQRNATNLTVYRINLFPSSQQLIGTSTVSTGSISVPLTIEYVPAHDSFNNIDYFTTTIKYNNGTIGTDSTYSYTGKNLKDLQLYAETLQDANITNLTLKSMNLVKTSNPNPTYNSFQNGNIDSSGGVTVISPPPEESFPCNSENDCTIIPGPIVDTNRVCNVYGYFFFGVVLCQDYTNTLTTYLPKAFFSDQPHTVGGNNVFWSQCTYDNAGTYKQRHFVSAVNSINDWTIYKDLTVTIDGQTTNSTVLLPDGQPAIQTPDGTTNPVAELFTGFGIGSGMALVIWLLFSVAMGVVVTAIIAKLGGMGAGMVLGIVTFFGLLIAGYPLGLIPGYVIIMLIVFAALAIAGTARMVLSGG